MVDSFYVENGRKISSNIFLDQNNHVQTYWFFDLDSPKFDRFLNFADLVRHFYKLPAFRLPSMTPGNFHILVPVPSYHVYCLLCSCDRRGYFRFKHIKFLRWTSNFQAFLEENQLRPLIFKQINADKVRETVTLNDAPLPKFRATVEYMIRSAYQVNPIGSYKPTELRVFDEMLPSLELARTFYQTTINKKRWKIPQAQRDGWKQIRQSFRRQYIKKYNLKMTEQQLAQLTETKPNQPALNAIQETTPILQNIK